MAKNVDELPECEACAALPRRVRRATDLSHQRTVTRELLRRLDALDLIARDAKVRHEVDEADVIGFYTFDDEPPELCSYDEWEHWTGVLLYSRCGQLLRIGMVCARRYLRGIERASDYHKRQLELDTERERKPSQTLEILAKAQGVAGQAQRLLQGRQAMKQWLTKFERALADAVRDGRAYVENDESRWDDVRGRHVPEFQRYELLGQELFERECAEGVFCPETVDQTLRETEDYVDWISPLELDHGNLREFQQKRKRIQERVQQLERLCEKAGKFWSTEFNLKAACTIAYRATGLVNAKVIGNTLRAKRTRKRLGAHGILEESPTPERTETLRSL